MPKDLRTIMREEQEKKRLEIQKIKELVRQNPQMNTIQIANAAGLPVYKVTQLIREGMLHVR